MNPYGVDISNSNIQAPLVSLSLLYDGMPKTTGCERCKEVNGDNEMWCCSSMSPSMYYVEFLKVWNIAQKWDKEKKANLILRAVKNYLDNSLNKGCIFFDGGCSCYEERPFSCRCYGVVPQKNWEKRWDTLKERTPDADLKPQCDMVSTVDGKGVTPDQEDKWFSHTLKCEERVGVDSLAIKLHDLAGGSYRTFHDHLLIELFPPQFLELLTKARLANPTKEDIEKTLNTVKAMVLKNV